MDFEVAIWEMTHLMVAPRKVFRNLYYQRRVFPLRSSSSTPVFPSVPPRISISRKYRVCKTMANVNQFAETKNTTYPSDPALPYLTLLFQLLASFAWSLAYAPKYTLRILTSFLLLQYLLFTVALAFFSYLVIPHLLGPRGLLKDFTIHPAGRALLGKKRRGLFREATLNPTDGSEDATGLDFGYSLDVAVRTYIPLLVYLSLLQFLLMPILAPSSHSHLSATLSNILHAVAFTHALYVTFLGYSALPFLQNTQLLLVPGVAMVWGLAVILSAVGVSMTGQGGLVGWVPGLPGVLRSRQSPLAPGQSEAIAPRYF